MKNLETVDAVILCGGKGERLRSVVPDRPKALALVRGTPILDLLVKKFYDTGVRRFILCTGYLGDQIKEHLARLKVKNLFPSASFVFSEENEPLGTGGALRNAEAHIQSENFILTNGDTLWSVDFASLYKHHLSRETLFTFTLIDDKHLTNYGRVILSGDNTATSFIEKGTVAENSFISIGVYLINKKIFSYMPTQKSFSLEYDLLPILASQKLCSGFLAKSHFIDIGTPERYNEAQKESFA